MTALKDLLNKLPYLLICVLFVAKLAWDYFDFLESPDSELTQKKQSIDFLVQDIKSLQEKNQAAQEFLKSLEGKRVVIRDYANQLSEMKVDFNETIDVPGFIKRISTEAKETWFKSSSDSSFEVSEGRKLHGTSIHDGVFRGLPQVVGFIQRMANVQNIVRVDTVNINRVGSPDNKLVEIKGALGINAFTYNPSVVDEKINNLGKEGQSG